jgi:hypothetical protein
MLNEEELRDAALLELKDRNWTIVACSAVDGKGVNEGMDWLVVSSLKKNKTDPLANGFSRLIA